MLYLIDGYNVTRADEATRRLLPDAMRLALMRRLAVRGRDLLGAGRIVVVWDKGHLAGDETLNGVEAVFSGDGIADDIIVRMAEAEPGPVTVVTSDRELRSRVRERKGRATPVLPCSALFDEMRVPVSRRRRIAGDPNGGLPKGHETITAEFEDLWLSEEEK